MMSFVIAAIVSAVLFGLLWSLTNHDSEARKRIERGRQMTGYRPRDATPRSPD